MKNSLVLVTTLCFVSVVFAQEEIDDPAQIVIGERLFLETRFAQAYFASPGKADPVMEKTMTTDGSLKGPFTGKSMNCRACHMVDEFADQATAGMRTYADYARQSPIPDRGDGLAKAGRNSMSLVNISIPADEHVVFHFDGEFNSMADLVFATLTGRNYGWLPHETQKAIKHIAQVIRSDDGQGELAQEFGGSYKTILTGSDKSIKPDFRLPVEYRVDVKQASDRQLVDAVSKLIAVYVTDLGFARDDQGRYVGSPYDVFLIKNKLPRKPAVDESPEAYGQRLLGLVNKLEAPRYVNAQDGKFETHNQPFVFAEKELQGMKLFFSRGSSKQHGGNCVSCHSAPHFSDYGFHNTGLTQQNYDNTHGAEAFSKLDIPGLQKRTQRHDAYLPATDKHPQASSRFRSKVSRQRSGHVDLGLWNIFANPDMPAPQQKLQSMLCEQVNKSFRGSCTTDNLLTAAIASFKTPVLRDLGHSAPYMHTGQFDKLSQAVSLYITSAAMSREGRLRNGDPQLGGVNITTGHIEPLVAFLKSLNEDYD